MDATCTQVNVSIVVEQQEGARALEALHEEFFEGGVSRLMHEEFFQNNNSMDMPQIQ